MSFTNILGASPTNKVDQMLSWIASYWKLFMLSCCAKLLFIEWSFSAKWVLAHGIAPLSSFSFRSLRTFVLRVPCFTFKIKHTTQLTHHFSYIHSHFFFYSKSKIYKHSSKAPERTPNILLKTLITIAQNNALFTLELHLLIEDVCLMK